jgi:uncharacterized integral membrane protein (TIGR00698 family)
MRAAYDVMPNRRLPARAGSSHRWVVPAATEIPSPSGTDPRMPGLAAAGVGVAGAFAAHDLVGPVGVLTWAVALGVLATNVGALPAVAEDGLRLVMRRLLRVGVVLLGFSLSLASIAGLGPPVIALVVVTLTSTLALTWWAGRRLGIGDARALLVATGFAICGASAIAAMEETAEADDEDVTIAIAMVTLCGTVAMVVLPLLQAPLGLSDVQLGTWTGASVHEVGQVVAAAGPAGATAVGVAVVVKLTRVLLLAPVVAGVGLARRHDGGRRDAATPPLVPLFVLGFLAAVLLRSTGLVPDLALSLAAHLQTVTLAAALFAMGTGVHLASLLRGSGRVVLLGAGSTLVVATVSLAGVLVLGG